MQMLVIVLSKAAFLKLGAIDPFQCSHKEIQEEMEGEGQQGIYIYIIFPPKLSSYSTPCQTGYCVRLHMGYQLPNKENSIMLHSF